ncbi:MAG: hypothetical protein XD44_0173 [Methanobacteriaceae archaeon 41_258]|nr:MAG: hypothetical protein XD44_0173 [Methanobacteriaceae archaeon 41_258]
MQYNLWAGSQLFASSVLGLGFAETLITADKGEIKDFPKLLLLVATSFIRKTFSEIHSAPLKGFK